MLEPLLPIAIFSNICSSVSPRITAMLSLPVSTDSHITAVAALAATTLDEDPHVDATMQHASVSAAARGDKDFAVLRALTSEKMPLLMSTMSP